MAKYAFRCAQLDLARQKESLEFILQFVDYLAESGYNAMHLYLEDRIKTASYPYGADDESYTPAEIRRIVKYAAGKGIEVFPCVATLGHAERFLSHPELEPLAELQGDMKGRFGGTKKGAFCPSNPDVTAFLKAYMKEVAALFPSKYFHAGLDEVWDFVLCERCKKQAPDGKAEGQLFLAYVKQIHDILAKLGKTMVMWTDMIEFYPEILPDMPKDIVMADWQYQEEVRSLRDHFNSSNNTSLEKYEKLGFKVWICPAERFYSNGVTALEYGSRYKCVTGAMLTSWEKTDTYLFRTLPIFGAIGRVMNGEEPGKAMDEACLALFPHAKAQELAAFRMIADRIFPRHYESVAFTAIFGREFSSLPYTKLDERILCHGVLSRLLEETPEKSLSWLVLSDLLDSLLECVRSCEMNICAVKLIENGNVKQLLPRFQQLCDSYMKLYRGREAAWNLVRKGIPNFHTDRLPKVEKQLEEFAGYLKKQRFLRLRINHADWYGLNGLRVSLKVNGQWEQVWEGVAKPIALDHASMMEVYLPLKSKAQLNAEAVRLGYYGYGGAGVAHVALIENGQVVAQPQAILGCTGTVEHPEFILIDDSKFSWLGNQDMRYTYLHKETYDTGTCVDVSLK